MATDNKKVLRDEKSNRATVAAALLPRQLGLTADTKTIVYKDSNSVLSYYTKESGDAIYNTLVLEALSASPGFLAVDENGNVIVSNTPVTGIIPSSDVDLVDPVDESISGLAGTVKASLEELVDASDNAVNSKQYVNGFLDQDNVLIVFGINTDEATPRPVITVSSLDTVNDVDFYSDSIKLKILASSTTFKVFDGVTEGDHSVVLDETGELIFATTEDALEKYCDVGSIYWDTTNNKYSYDVPLAHGARMSNPTKAFLHFAIGSKPAEGAENLNLINMSTNGDGSLDAHFQYNANSGIYLNEDIRENLPEAPKWSPVYYEDVDGSVRFNEQSLESGFSADTHLWNAVGGRPFYNPFVGGIPQVVEVPDGKYFTMSGFGVGGSTTNHVTVMGKYAYDTLDEARRGCSRERSENLSRFDILRKIAMLSVVIYQTDDTYTNACKARIVEYSSIGDGRVIPYFDARSPESMQLPKESFSVGGDKELGVYIYNKTSAATFGNVTTNGTPNTIIPANVTDIYINTADSSNTDISAELEAILSGGTVKWKTANNDSIVWTVSSDWDLNAGVYHWTVGGFSDIGAIANLEQLVVSTPAGDDIIPEAPVDGKPYARKDGAWFDISKIDAIVTTYAELQAECASNPVGSKAVFVTESFTIPPSDPLVTIGLVNVFGANLSFDDGTVFDMTNGETRFHNLILVNNSKTLDIILGQVYMRDVGQPNGPATTLTISGDGSLLYERSNVLSIVGGATQDFWDNTGGGVGSYSQTFVDGDLSAGVLTVIHNLGSQAVCIITRDEDGKEYIAKENYPVDDNTIKVEFLGAITGTHTVIVQGGAIQTTAPESGCAQSTTSIANADSTLGSNNTVHAVMVYPSKDMEVTELMAFMSSGGADDITLGIYSINTGLLLGSVTSSGGVGSGELRLALGAPISLIAGDSYWFAIKGTISAANFVTGASSIAIFTRMSQFYGSAGLPVNDSSFSQSTELPFIMAIC